MTAQRDDISIAQILNNVNQYVVTIATHLDCYAQNRDSTALSESLLILEQTELQLNQINAAQGLTLLKEAKQLIELLQQRVSSPTQELLTYILQCLISLIPHAIQPEDSLAEDISNVLNDVRCLYATTPMVSSDVPRSMTIDQQGVGQDFIAVVSKLHHHYQQSLTGILKLKSPLHQYERLSRLFAKLQNICWKTPISPLWDTALGVCEALRAQQIQMSHQLLTILRSIDYQLRQLGTVGSNQINIAPEPQLLAQMRALVRHINSDNPLIIAMQQAQEPSHTLYVTVTIVVAQLSDFGLEQKTLVGDVENGRFTPYDDRQAIEQSNPDKDDVLLWLKDPVDKFFLQVQGSGNIELPKGEIKHVGYAGNNGHNYVPIGSILKQAGELTDVSMQSIRQWLKDNPSKREWLFNKNPRYIFFTFTDQGAITATGAPAVAMRTLAVDPATVPLNLPVWVDTTLTATDAPFQQLMMAQDTGSAIKGTVRGDIYMGMGKEAAKLAGEQQSAGKLYVLTPR